MTNTDSEDERVFLWLENRSECEARGLTRNDFERFQGAPFTIVRRIGSGGFGSVFLAKDISDGSLLAVKTPLNRPLDAETNRRISEEARTIERLDHPHIPAFVAKSGEVSDDSFYITMQFIGDSTNSEVPAPTLQEWARPQPSTTAKLRVLAQVCRAVAHAHRHGIIHRDLKPSNILVTQHENTDFAYVIDFGVARIEDITTLTQEPKRIGSEVYMSPEQAQRKKVSHATDIYSLGLVAYELITGKHPFAFEHGEKRPDSSSILKCILLGEKPRPASLLLEDGELPQTVASSLDQVLFQALRLEPGKRQDTADRLAEQFDSLAELQVVDVAAEGPLAAMRRSVRRNRILLSVLSVLCGGLLIAVVGLVLGFIQSRSNEAEATAAREISDERAQIATETFLRIAAATNPHLPASDVKAEEVRQEIIDSVTDGFDQIIESIPDDASSQQKYQRIYLERLRGDYLSMQGKRSAAMEAYESALAASGELSQDADRLWRREMVILHTRLADHVLGFTLAEAQLGIDSLTRFGDQSFRGPGIVHEFAPLRLDVVCFLPDELADARMHLEVALTHAVQNAEHPDDSTLYRSDVAFLHAKLAELAFHDSNENDYRKHHTLAVTICDEILEQEPNEYYACVVAARQHILHCMLCITSFADAEGALSARDRAIEFGQRAAQIQTSEVESDPILEAMRAELKGLVGMELMRRTTVINDRSLRLVDSWYESHPSLFLNVPRYWFGGNGNYLVNQLFETVDRLEPNDSRPAGTLEQAPFISPSTANLDAMLFELRESPCLQTASWDRIQQGVTKEEVMSIFGDQGTTVDVAFNGRETLRFDGVLARGALIQFDATGRVDRWTQPRRLRQ